jgi:beta-glucanase (GH16 family)
MIRRSRILIGMIAVLSAAAAISISGPAPSSADPPAESKRACRPNPQITARMRPTFRDEFGGRSLNEAKWNTVMDFPGRAGGHYHNTSYGSYALDENVVLKGGQLNLIANDEPVTGTDPVGEFEYSEGFISSHDKFFQRYGYWEICAKFPAGKGLWPAFWLVPQDRSWPPEIDVAEWFGSIEGMHSGLATGNWPDVRWDSHWSYGDAPTSGWHTYSVLWEPDRLVFFTDGSPTYEVTGEVVPDKDMYVILNSGTWAPADRGGPPDETTVFPNAFEVDYVRVYQSRDAG